MAAKRSNYRKSLKEPDEFITLSSRLLIQAMAHKKQIIVATTGFIGVALVVLFFHYFSEKAANRSLLQLSHAMAKYTGSDTLAELDDVKDELLGIAENYGRYSGGKFARLELANLYFKGGEFKAAVDLYRQSVNDFKGYPLVEILAKSGLGYALEATGESEEATKWFESIAANSDDIMADEALFALNRLYATTGDGEKQTATLGQLIDQYPDSFYIKLAKEKASL